MQRFIVNIVNRKAGGVLVKQQKRLKSTIMNINHVRTKEEPLTTKDKVLHMLQPTTLDIARECLWLGHVIALPTDTVYGLACDANNVNAIRKLYAIKGRDGHKPVAICVKNLEAFRLYGKAEHLNDDLLQRLLPGPITIIVERSSHLSNPYLNPTTRKIGIRIPDFRFIQDLCDKIDRPLALTSANRSTEKSSLQIEEFKGLWPDLGCVVNAGAPLGRTEEQRSASTVVDLSLPGYYSVVRGGVALKSTLEVMAEFQIKRLEDVRS